MLYILTGLPYAGKTTLRDKLVKRFGFSVASVDEVIDEKGFEVEEMTQDDWNSVYSEAYTRLKSHLSKGKSVVVDIGNLKRSERQTAKNIAESMGVKHKLIYINTPIDEIRKRRLVNQETKQRGHLEDTTMERALNMFEEPMKNEHPIFYNSTIDFDKWVAENID